MTDDRYDDVDLDEHRALVDALPYRLLPVVAAGLMTAQEARAQIRRSRQVLAARLGAADAPQTHRSTRPGRPP